MRSVVVVEPEVPENTGFIARLAANYGYGLRIVDPGFNLGEARKTAKNAQGKLREARIFDSLEEAVDDLSYVVGTKPGRGVALKDFEPREDTSIVIGRESSGLSNAELEMCDAVVHVETSGYESLNQSHAAGIMMHGMHPGEEPSLTEKQREKISELTGSGVLEELLLRANPSKSEAGNAIKELLGMD